MFDPLKRAARMFFHDEVRLRRDKDGLRLALEAPEERDRKHSQLDEQETRERERLKQMAQELQTVLAADAAKRYPPRQLIQVHQALQAEGLAMLGTLPLAVLRTALDQLEDAVTNWSPVGLATLRSKIAVAVQERSARGESDAPLQMSTDELRAQYEAAAQGAVAQHTTDEADEQAALLAVYGSLKGVSANHATTTPDSLPDTSH